ncbi:carboxypeptidase regulatory-like domain-containing protein [Sphingobium sp.]|uniref:carboxypeptidase regulatory-like domain-containing protein n=1 Tax=Sphingobium sp. TaxID=1912891 RepID=UPI003B3A86E7
MSLEIATAFLMVMAVLLGWARLMLWHRAVGKVGQASVARLILLLCLQPVSAGILFFALFPPATDGDTRTLRIATAGTSKLAGATKDAPLILLPEAADIDGGVLVPDLATALRQHPGVTAITVLGNGLTPRDVDAARALAVRFTPPPQRPGIVHLAQPPAIAPGGRFSTSGTLAGVDHASVELIDPAGRITDQTAPDRDGHFSLNGTARAAGTAIFTLRVRSGKRAVEQAEIPVWTTNGGKRLRLLIFAGAPGPEVKYLRRWASDAGFDVSARMSAGGGIALGDAPVAMSTAELRRFDVAIVDDRAWPAMRGPIMAAVRDGLGLILRAGGAIDGTTRSQWQALGFALDGPGGIVPVALPKADEQAVMRSRHGIGSEEAPIDMALPEDIAPEVSRFGLMPGGGNAVALLHDDAGADLAAWRAVGNGRVAIFNMLDSYALRVTGRGDLYDDWWNALAGTVARPTPTDNMMQDVVWVGERMTLCDLPQSTRLAAPDGKMITLSPVSGCAAFWPEKPGWHYLRKAGELRAFFVRPTTVLTAMRNARDGQATAMLRQDEAGAARERVPQHVVSTWHYWLAWFAITMAMWWFERSRMGRRTAIVPNPPLATSAAAP